MGVLRRVRVLGLLSALFGLSTAHALFLQPRQTLHDLPNAPSALRVIAADAVEPEFPASGLQTGTPTSSPTGTVTALAPCTDGKRLFSFRFKPKNESGTIGGNCTKDSRLQPVVNSKAAPQLSVGDKGMLAIRDIIDPFNLITVVGYSGFAIAANAHSAYGPGWEGFGTLTGYSFIQDAQGEFFGTFLIPSLTHQDPRYHRLPTASVPRRIVHAIAHTYVSSHDDGTPMPNYATLLTYPVSAELSNLYVPGVSTGAGATARRVGIGLATDPAGALVAEFLPDVAKRIHIRIIFVQEILNRVVTGAPSTF